MNSLIPIAPVSGETALVPVFLGQIGGVPAHVCKATDLHVFLEAGTKFADWFTARVEKYGFVQDQDFALISENSEIKKGRGGDRKSKDYLLGLDMAKELSMVENNAKGREARRYFIAMERKALEAAGQVVPASHQETLIPSEQQTLSEIVHHKVAHLTPELQGKALAEAWSRLHRKFRIAKYSQLPRTQLSEAIVYVTSLDLRCAPAVPVTDPADDDRISPQQVQDISRAVHGCLSGWIFHDQDAQQVYNTLHVAFHIQRIADLPASDFEPCLLLIAAIKDWAGHLLTLVSEIRASFFRDHLRGGLPWTPQINRVWKARMKTAIPPRPDWIALQRQLAASDPRFELTPVV
jgi:phage anti-repressor protein